MNIIIFGYAYEGIKLYRELMNNDKYKVIGFADNSSYKQGNKVGSHVILSMHGLVQLKSDVCFSVIIAANKWYVIGEELEKFNIPIEGIYLGGNIVKYDRMSFEKLDLSRKIKFYAGDICDDIHMADSDLFGLSINKADSRHIFHDITNKYPLPDNCVYSYQAEDVLEHISPQKLIKTINEIYRILRKGGLFRICLPDYFSPYLKDISMKDKYGNIIFDPMGGGSYGANGVINGGHVWFPTFENVSKLLQETMFKDFLFLCYHTEKGLLVRKEIDFSKGHILRIPKDERSEWVYSIIIDCYK